MPLNLVMKNIGVKTAVPQDGQGLPEYPVTLIEIEEGGVVNTVSISAVDARYLCNILQGWLKICESNGEVI